MLWRYICAVIVLGVAPWAHAQQSFFNAFSGDRTQEGAHFVQLQANLDAQSSNLNNTYSYGLTKNFEIGLNWFDLPLHADSRQFRQDQEALVNAQYFYDLKDWWQVSAGIQAGRSHLRSRGKYAQLLYVNSKWENEEHGVKAVLGVLKGNNNYLEREEVIVQMGLEVPIIRNKVHFVSDYLTGTTENSVGVSGFVLPINEEVSLSLGYQYPSANSKNAHAFVFEFTYAGRATAKD